MRLIDADALKEAWIERLYVYIVNNGGDVFGAVKDKAALEFIDEQPTIDAVPVVRCKECKHRPIDTGGHNYGQDLFFPDEDNVCPCQCGDKWYSWMPGDDWFCANGERREDD
jgi:hypothetical protein